MTPAVSTGFNFAAYLEATGCRWRTPSTLLWVRNGPSRCGRRCATPCWREANVCAPSSAWLPVIWPAASPALAMPTAVALEMIHTMSLIHDDLPAMDDDDLRRGRPTNHKVYGEAKAILAGDALLTRAFEMVALRSPGVPPERLLAVVGELSLAAGAPGLVGGQVVDLESRPGRWTWPRWNTSTSTRPVPCCGPACLSGALVAGASKEMLTALEVYARGIGLAFQIIDDILDVTSSSEVLGKTAGKDQVADKTTYPKLLGLEESRRRAEDLVAEAREALSPWQQQRGTSVGPGRLHHQPRSMTPPQMFHLRRWQCSHGSHRPARPCGTCSTTVYSPGGWRPVAWPSSPSW